MSIYTKAGDNGMTNLSKLQNVSKTDDRITLLGNVDELTSNLGLIKTNGIQNDVRIELERIQQNLLNIKASVSEQYNKDYKIEEEEIVHLELEIDQMEKSFSQEKDIVLPGGNVKSAQLDVARAITRRTERSMIAVDKKFNADRGAKKYLNRLADYLYILARYTDYLYENNNDKEISLNEVNSDRMNDDIINAVVNKLGLQRSRIDLDTAKKLITRVEEQAAKLGLNAVIAVCGPDGNPIAVHVMDNAYLASFDIAMKKAYTSVAVKMSTKQLGELAQSGGPLYGIDKADNGRIIIFGGGVPLMAGDTIIGGLGVSGGSLEQDTYMGDFGATVLQEVLNTL